MIKFLINILEIAIILRVLYKTVRWLWGGRKKRKYRKTILGKVILLISRRIHYSLDCMIKKQKESLANSKQDQKKVIDFRRYKHNTN